MKSDLRTQFLNFMTLQRFSHHTKRLYINSVKGLAKFYNQSPDTLTNDQIQDYLRYLLEDIKLLGNMQQLFFRYCVLLQKYLQLG